MDVCRLVILILPGGTWCSSRHNPTAACFRTYIAVYFVSMFVHAIDSYSQLVFLAPPPLGTWLIEDAQEMLVDRLTDWKVALSDTGMTVGCLFG